MAKLSARGRKELVRLEREVSTPNDTLVSWRRTSIAIMDDGKVLEKSDVKFASDGKRHAYPWTVKAKYLPENLEKLVRLYEERGFRKAA